VMWNGEYRQSRDPAKVSIRSVEQITKNWKSISHKNAYIAFFLKGGDVEDCPSAWNLS
jgi:hypothetical protein